ncbi:UNVERIFIED_CONTAM: hypothetical protein Scaly_0863900 [Sesamum calycinum]|uniref:Uncharacterized protein n=1 Tax=Sesamum calycinum TaxID=2727403 RepID=A0AAW2QVU0_9LAMI
MNSLIATSTRLQSRRTKGCRHYKNAIDYGGHVKKVLDDNKPFTAVESHFVDAKYYIEDAKKGKEVLPPKSQSQINMKQPSKPPLKGFVPSTKEEEGGHEALAIDEKGFNPKAFKLLIKAGYNPKEKLSLKKLPPEATDKKLHGLNTTQIMLKEKEHANQDSRVGLSFTPPKLFRIAIKRVNNNYASEGFSSIEDHKREENWRESVFDRLGPHRKQLHGITNRKSIFDSKVEEEDAEDAPIELEEGIKATIDKLKEVNLGNIENPRPIYISASLTQEEKEPYIALLHEFKDVFAWSYKKIPGLDPKAKNKLIEVSFIRDVKYPMWISSIVPVRKKNGQIRVCVDFKDLNNACPKDDFPLPIVELMIDTTTGHEALSFMDGSSGYNQIRMAPADEELTAFCTPKVGHCQPFSRLMKKDVPFQWDEACDKAFKSIKSYLMKPPVFVAPVPGRPLILCVAAQESFAGILLAQKNDEGKENAFIHLVLKANPLKYVMAKPVLSDRLARWYLQLQQFEITFVPQKIVKGQVLANFLVDRPMPAEWELSDDLPDKDVLVIEVTPLWKMYLDGASHKEGVGDGVVFVTSEGKILPYSFILTQNCSDNVTEYQALISELEIVVDAKQLPLKGNSQLVVNQLLSLYEVKKPELLPYHNYAKKANWMARRCRIRASTKERQQKS